MLLVGSVLSVRSYLGLVRLDKGFDSSGVVAISLTIPPQRQGSGAERAAMARTILERLRARPGVLGAFEGSPPPSTGDSPTANNHIEIDAGPPIETLWPGGDAVGHRFREDTRFQWSYVIGIVKHVRTTYARVCDVARLARGGNRHLQRLRRLTMGPVTAVRRKSN
jgi:hypothetical protein